MHEKVSAVMTRTLLTLLGRVLVLVAVRFPASRLTKIIASNAMSRRFTARKRELVTKLAEFIDRSPKGSVDEPICELISYINQQDGYVRSSHV